MPEFRLQFIENKDEFELNNILLDAINIHNNNIHTKTKYKPIELFSNTNEDVFNEMNKNIKKGFINKNKYVSEVNKGDKLLLKKETYPCGRISNKKHEK